MQNTYFGQFSYKKKKRKKSATQNTYRTDGYLLKHGRWTRSLQHISFSPTLMVISTFVVVFSQCFPTSLAHKEIGE